MPRTKRRRRRICSPPSYQQHSCGGCDFSFRTRTELIKHKTESLNDNCHEGLIFCPQCNKGFISQYSLDMHYTKSPSCNILNDLPNAVSTIAFGSGIGPRGGAIPADHTVASKVPSVNANREADESDGYVRNEDSDEESVEPTKISAESIYISIVNKSNSNRKQQVVTERRSLMNPSFRIPNSSSTAFSRDYSTTMFRQMCVNENKELSLDIKSIRGSITIGTKDRMMLDCFEETVFNSPQFYGTLEYAMSCFWNTCYSISSFCDIHSPVIEHDDVLRFLESYSTLKEIDASVEESSGNGTLNNNQDDIIRNNNQDEEMNTDETLGTHDESYVNTDLCKMQGQIMDARNGVVFENSELAKVDLYEMLSKANCPKYLFEDIQRWAIKHADDLKGSNPSKRKTFVQKIGKKIYGQEPFKKLKPLTTNVVLPRGSVLPVVTFPLKSCIVSLLSNCNLMKDNNLLIDIEDPFRKSQPGDVLEDINSGWWYFETRDELCTGPSDVLLPLLMFIDGSNVDKNGRLSVEPVSMTLGIFNRETRNLPQAWRTLGFVESLDNKVSEDLVVSKKSVFKLQDYHSIITHILTDLKYLQGKNGGFHWNLVLNGVLHPIVFKVALQVIIGDCKGNDMLCGRYGSHSRNTSGFCRDCKVPFSLSDDPYHQCHFIHPSDIQGKSERDLNSIGFHHINNAFDSIYFGARSLGIYGCTPSEPLHAFKLGLCKYFYETFNKDFPSETKKLIDKKLKRIIKTDSNQNIRSLPSITVLRNGLDKCSTLTADDQFARIFGVYMCLLDPSILKSLATDTRYKQHEEKKHPVAIGPMNVNAAIGWIRMFEDTIVYHAWLYSDSHNRKDFEESIADNTDSLSSSSSDSEESDYGSSRCRESVAQTAVRKYLDSFRTIVRRKEGNQLKVNKFHQQLHNCREILKDGALLNVDGGRPESIAIDTLKKPGSLTQKRVQSLTRQMAENLMSDQVMADARDLIDQQSTLYSISKVDKPAYQLYGSRFAFQLSFPDGSFNVGVDDVKIDFKWKGEAYHSTKFYDLCKGVAKRLYINVGPGGCLRHNSVVDGFTEYHIGDLVFRSHPCYRNEREWTDWAMIKWDEVSEPIPAKICMFLNLENSKMMTPQEHQQFRSSFESDIFASQNEDNNESMRDSQQFLTRSKWVVIQSCLSEEEEGIRTHNRYRVQSRIGTRYYLEDKWRLIAIESIVDAAFCLQIGEKGDEVICFQDKKEWKNSFLDTDE